MKKRYSQTTVIKALSLYRDGKSLKEIRIELDLPEGNNGESLISQWRRRAGMSPRQQAKNWQAIRNAIGE